MKLFISDNHHQYYRACVRIMWMGLWIWTENRGCILRSPTAEIRQRISIFLTRFWCLLYTSDCEQWVSVANKKFRFFSATVFVFKMKKIIQWNFDIKNKVYEFPWNNMPQLHAHFLFFSYFWLNVINTLNFIQIYIFIFLWNL